MAERIAERGLCNVSEYYGTEVNIFYPGLYAGQTDLACVHNGSDAIVDFLADAEIAFCVVGLESFTKLMQIANKRIKFSVKTQGGLSESNIITSSVMQGDVWGPTLASVQTEQIGSQIEKEGLGYKYRGKLQIWNQVFRISFFFNFNFVKKRAC